ncbi:hypothetical protein F5Y13DRAFT_182401 [Hypoxylon sp. FL1857]|nr:hypothetical protein F5Y13DRAFT_182401 [Hypoxylon sp. FL1857]
MPNTGVPKNPAGDCKYKDAFGRETVIQGGQAGHEHYIRSKDGKLARLIVQGSQLAKGRGDNTPQWSADGRSWGYKTNPEVHVPFIMKLVCWMYAFIHEEGGARRQDVSRSSKIAVSLIWLPSCLVLAILLLIPANLEGALRNRGFYDPILYRDWGFPKVSRNRYESPKQPDSDGSEEGEDMNQNASTDIEAAAVSRPLPTRIRAELVKEKNSDDIMPRHYGPKYLCFLTEGGQANGEKYKTCEVANWIKDHGEHNSPDFVFISYTRRHFCVDTEKEILNPDNWKHLSDTARTKLVSIADKDRKKLLEFGVEAARSAGKPAFWIDFECIRDADNESKAVSQSEDVYRICDIVRAAHSMVILVGPSVESKLPGGTPESYSPEKTIEWLQTYGDRLWTLPEVLLCPSDPIKLHFLGGPESPEEVPKRSFPARAVWRDAHLVRQLVDHYESTIHLSPLELVSIGLECLSTRGTQTFNKGDVAYALMGLLRRRPKVVKADTSFEAFARLSLANVSDALLERLLCMQPIRRNPEWYRIEDAWDVRLWDIEPRCQVAGIADDQTVTLDGAFGATIQWDSINQIAFFKRPTLARTIAKFALRTVPLQLLLAIVMLAEGSASNSAYDKGIRNQPFVSQYNKPLGFNGPGKPLLIVGIVFIIPSVILTLLAPWLIFKLYRGKFWSTQAMFIGLEGKPDDLGWIERCLFGLNQGRLKWSAAGSTPSQRKLSADSDREQRASPSDTPKFIEEERLFTLIDTYSMTATTFRAERPPSALIVCGQEGGMQRAVLCSYDWQRATFAREAVVRIKTMTLDRMSRVDRFRFALGRMPAKTS